MYYPGSTSTSTSSNRGSSSSAWSYHTSPSSVSLPRTPTIGIANLPPSPATPSNIYSGGGVQSLAPYMGSVSLPPSEPGTPRYHTGMRPFIRVETRRMLMSNRRFGNSSGEPDQRVKEDAFRSSVASNPRTQPYTKHLLQRHASNTRACCASQLHQFQRYYT